MYFASLPSAQEFDRAGVHIGSDPEAGILAVLALLRFNKPAGRASASAPGTMSPSWR